MPGSAVGTADAVSDAADAAECALSDAKDSTDSDLPAGIVIAGFEADCAEFWLSACADTEDDCAEAVTEKPLSSVPDDTCTGVA